MRAARWFALTLAVTFGMILATDAGAVAIGAQSGAARDWIRTSSDGDWVETGLFQAGLSIDAVMGVNEMDEGVNGLSFGLRLTDDTNISQYLVEYWAVTNALEWFVGGNLDVWEKELTGSTEFLGGGRGGIRIDAAGIPFEVSGHYSAGSDGRGHGGFFFGLRLTNDL